MPIKSDGRGPRIIYLPPSLLTNVRAWPIADACEHPLPTRTGRSGNHFSELGPNYPHKNRGLFPTRYRGQIGSPQALRHGEAIELTRIESFRYDITKPLIDGNIAGHSLQGRQPHLGEVAPSRLILDKMHQFAPDPLTVAPWIDCDIVQKQVTRHLLHDCDTQQRAVVFHYVGMSCSAPLGKIVIHCAGAALDDGNPWHVRTLN